MADSEAPEGSEVSSGSKQKGTVLVTPSIRGIRSQSTSSTACGNFVAIAGQPGYGSSYTSLGDAVITRRHFDATRMIEENKNLNGMVSSLQAKLYLVTEPLRKKADEGDIDIEDRFIKLCEQLRDSDEKNRQLEIKLESCKSQCANVEKKYDEEKEAWAKRQSELEAQLKQEDASEDRHLTSREYDNDQRDESRSSEFSVLSERTERDLQLKSLTDVNKGLQEMIKTEKERCESACIRINELELQLANEKAISQNTLMKKEQECKKLYRAVNALLKTQHSKGAVKDFLEHEIDGNEDGPSENVLKDGGDFGTSLTRGISNDGGSSVWDDERKQQENMKTEQQLVNRGDSEISVRNWSGDDERRNKMVAFDGLHIDNEGDCSHFHRGHFSLSRSIIGPGFTMAANISVEFGQAKDAFDAVYEIYRRLFAKLRNTACSLQYILENCGEGDAEKGREFIKIIDGLQCELNFSVADITRNMGVIDLTMANLSQVIERSMQQSICNRSEVKDSESLQIYQEEDPFKETTEKLSEALLQVTELKNQLEEAECENKKMEVERKKAQDGLVKTLAQNSELEKDLASANALIAKQESIIKEINENSSGLQKEVLFLKERTAALEAGTCEMFASLKETIADVPQKIAETTAFAKTMQKNADISGSQVSKQIAEVDARMQGEFTSLRAELQSHIATLLGLLERAESKREQAERKYDELVKRDENIKDNLKEARAVIEDFERRRRFAVDANLQTQMTMNELRVTEAEFKMAKASAEQANENARREHENAVHWECELKKMTDAMNVLKTERASQAKAETAARRKHSERRKRFASDASLQTQMTMDELHVTEAELKRTKASAEEANEYARREHEKAVHMEGELKKMTDAMNVLKTESASQARRDHKKIALLECELKKRADAMNILKTERASQTKPGTAMGKLIENELRGITETLTDASRAVQKIHVHARHKRALENDHDKDQ